MLGSCLREKEESVPEIKSPLEFIKQSEKKNLTGLVHKMNKSNDSFLQRTLRLNLDVL